MRICKPSVDGCSPTINGEIRALLGERQFADDVLRDLTAFFSGLGSRDTGQGESLEELLTIDGVPVWELLQHELLQILEPALYRAFVAKAAVQRHVGEAIAIHNENPSLTEAVRLFAASDGKRARVVRTVPPNASGRDEEAPRYPPVALSSASPARIDRLERELARYGQESTRRKVLVSIEWMGNAQILRPLLERLSRREGLSVHILRRSRRHDYSGIDAKRVWANADVLALGAKSSDTAEREAAQAVRRLESLQSWLRVFRVGDVDIEPLVRRRLKTALSIKRMAAATCRAKSLSRFVELLRPDLVVNADGIMLTPVALDWAAAAHTVPRLKILHYDEQLFRMWTLLSTKRWDRVAVMGPGPRAALEALGVPPARIVHTGYPYFDRRRITGPETGGHVGSKRRVLFTAQGLAEEPTVFGWLLDAFERLPDYALVARPHPLRPKSLDEALQGRAIPANVSISQAGELYDEIKSCSLLVTISSITAIEASLLGKPVLIVEPRPGWPYFPSMFYQARGLGRHLFDPNMLPQAIRELCRNPELTGNRAMGLNSIWNDYFRFNQRPSEKTSTERIEGLILDLLR